MGEERCARCGGLGEDRRTLWHSCFYEMNELNIPFEQFLISGKLGQKIGEEPHPIFKGLSMPTYSEDTTDTSLAVYTLRVCKDCRADWLETIRQWYNNPPEQQKSPETGIFVRHLGKTIEVTEEEFQRIKEKL